MKSTVKPRKKPRIKSKNKSYPLQDSPFYKLTTKKRLVNLLGKKISKLEALTASSNYRVFFLEKNGKKREIQSPTFKLDMVQTRIASMLVRLATPDYLHSGIKGHSNITNAKTHIGNHPVLTMDIQKFYPSITKKSIFNFFHKTLNASPDVAGILAEICSYENHIPTGSRLSMPLSYWATHLMYSRIHSLCVHKNVNFSVFVDDLTFSGDNVNKLFQKSVQGIVSDAGLTVHPEKSRLYSREKSKLVTGVILSEDGIKVRNKHHKAIYTQFSELPTCENDEQLELMQRQLIGRLNAAGQIEPKFKTKAYQLGRKDKE